MIYLEYTAVSDVFWKPSKIVFSSAFDMETYFRNQQETEKGRIKMQFIINYVFF